MIAWGTFNQYGQANVPPPAQTGVIAIASGFEHSLALKNDGAVVAWGSNAQGQTNVPSGLSNVVAIAAGASHSLALRSDGTVVAWGYNSSGQSSVPSSLSNAVAISGGAYHSLAVTSLAPAFMRKLPPVLTFSLGDNANLAPVVYSAFPFSSQWYLNGVAITTATNRSLNASPFDSQKVGYYALTIK